MLRRFRVVASVLLLGCLGLSSPLARAADESTSTTERDVNVSLYDVVKRDTAITLDGKLDDEVWGTVPVISGGFHFPWDTKEAPLTVFKAYSDGTYFYFSFDVTDENVVVEEEWKEDESTVDMEDRVELFFAGSNVDRPGPKGMELYYAIEVDPKGRVHDYSVKYYRDFDSKWQLEGLETQAELTDKGYTVEGKVPLQSFKDLNLLRGQTMRTGVFRAEFSPSDKEEPLMEWISWVNPHRPAPDFHVDGAFGEFRFLE
ncbi:carbohydrate-binding family 9-like protein [Aerococcaceae bacterium NML190073]|nr:carbohydrate-binding family 9-like protein [Aerococcaceae bacterium NML190073]